MTLTLINCSSDYLQQFLLFWCWKSLCRGTSCFSSSSHKGSWKMEAEPRSASPLQRSEWVTFQADEIMLYFEEDRCEQMCNPVIQSAGSFYLFRFYVPVFFLPLSIRIFFLLLNLFAVFVNITIINLRTNLLLTRQTLLCIYCNEHIDSVMTPKLTWTWWGYLCLIHDVWLSYSCRHVGCYCRSYILYIMHFAFYLYTFIDR